MMNSAINLIIIPLYNAGDGSARIFNYANMDCSIIIINDGSTDKFYLITKRAKTIARSFVASRQILSASVARNR